jgi:nitrogen fixation NifU-like protein
VYSETVQRILADPAHTGELAEASHKGVAGAPGEGPYLILWLEIVGDTILRASFQTYGCPAAVASGSLLTTLVTGMPVEKTRLLTSENLLLLLGGLPEGKEFCAALAIDALSDALKGWENLNERLVSVSF